MRLIEFRYGRFVCFARRAWLWAAVSCAVAFGVSGVSGADRPSAMKLFPEESIVFVRVSNGHEFGEKASQGNFGRMLQDPELKPLVDNLYGKVGDLYTQEGASKVGVTWEELKKLPKGEIAFAVVARPEKRPALLLLIDQGEEASVADKLVDRALDLAKEKGGEFSTEKIGDVEVTVVRDKDRENRMFGVCRRENVILVATDANVIHGVLWHWDHAGEAGAAAEADAATVSVEVKSEDAPKEGEAAAGKKTEEFVPGKTLAENPRFVTIVKNCRRPQDPPPQLMYYVDPIEVIRNFGRGSGGVSFALGLFPSLGLDGLQAIGGAITYATDEYDSLMQMHVLLQNPRAGVMLIPAFEPGDLAPQPFVPLSVETYLAWNWNMRTAFDRVAAMVDQFRYQGSVAKFVQEKLTDKLGIDVQTKVIDNLKGRYTWTIGYERPSHFRGQQHVFAAELVDEKGAQESLDTVVKRFPEIFEERHFGSVTYYGLIKGGVKAPRRPQDQQAEPDDPDAIVLTPFVAIMDGYFFIGTSCQRFEQYIAARDGTVPRLVDSADYIRTSAVIGRETVGTTPVLFSMNRFEETLRQWYDLLTSEKTRKLIDENKEKVRMLKALADAMEENKLPPFETLMKYTGAGGGILYDTDDGYHGISFELRNEQTPQ
ncbi:MAG: hypothetical protein U0805_11845 [Pirellulales bacterium]